MSSCSREGRALVGVPGSLVLCYAFAGCLAIYVREAVLRRLAVTEVVCRLPGFVAAVNGIRLVIGKEMS